MKIGTPIDTAALPAVEQVGAAVGGTGRTETGGAKKGAPRRSTAAARESAPVRPPAAATRLRTLAATPGFDAVKVQALRQAIDDGSYRVDAGVIAERLIGCVRKLPGRLPH